MLIVFILVPLLVALVMVWIWSTRIYPSIRQYEFDLSPGIHIPNAHQTMMHRTFSARHKLPELVQRCVTDAQMVAEVTQWVHQLWQPKAGRSPKSDNPLTIVHRALNGERFSRADYSIVLAHSLMAVGIPCRTVTLHTRDYAWRPVSSNYDGIEYFDRDQCQWVWLDPQWGIRVRQEGHWLNVLELKDALLNQEVVHIIPDTASLNSQQYLKHLRPFLEFFVICPVGQKTKYALVPQKMSLPKKKWIFGQSIYNIACQSQRSFYAKHPFRRSIQSIG